MNKMKKKQIVIYPSKESKSNKYINNLNNTISEVYDTFGFDEVKGKKKFFGCDIYHFNWIENVGNSNFKNTIKLLLRRIMICVLKLLNKKIIWTVHNNIPHNAKNQKQVLKYMKFMAKKSDRIHVLCSETIKNSFLNGYEQKIILIPHGDYINSYQKSDVDIYKRYNISTNKKIILFIGMIRKYKNIELLIDSFKNSHLEDNNFVLLICGECADETYREQIKTMANSNIYFDFNFIKDEEMEAYLRQAQIIIAPYNKISSLNSGTLWMAMSYKKTMVLPLIGCVKDIENYDDFLYVYDYNSEQEHYNELLKCMKKMNKDIEENKDILKVKGEDAYSYIVNNQSWNIRKKEWINLYKF